MPQKKLREWRRVLTRIENDQIGYLDRQVTVFRLFQESLSAAQLPQHSTLHLVTNWMALNYIAFASTCIRKAVEPEKRQWATVSLWQLLVDLQTNSHLLTYDRFRRKFRRHRVPDRYIDVQWKRHYGKGKVVSKAMIARDLRNLKRAAAPAKRLSDKLIAHTEKDRRKWPKVVLGQLRMATEVLLKTYHKYNVLIRGHPYNQDLPAEEQAEVKAMFSAFWHAAASEPRFSAPKARE